MDSPSGIICTAMRRVGDKIWVRINEYLKDPASLVDSPT
jgi:hypothetical protein